MLPRYVPIVQPNAFLLGKHSHCGQRLDRAAAALLRQTDHSPVAFRLLQRLLRERRVRCGYFEDGNLMASTKPASYHIKNGEFPMLNWRSALGAGLMPTPLSSACLALQRGDTELARRALSAAQGTTSCATYGDAVLQDTVHQLLPGPLLELARGGSSTKQADASHQPPAAPPSWGTPSMLLAFYPDMAFVNKPAGVVSQGVQGGAHSPTRPHLLQAAPWLLEQRAQLKDMQAASTLAMDAVHPPAVRIGHRLDAPVSGVVALPLTRAGADHLRQALRVHASSHSASISKRYVALLRGPWPAGTPLSGSIRSPLPTALGKPAQDSSTRYKALGNVSLRGVTGPCAVVELQPITGRKHQLRIHCAQHLGLPILGDVRYGDAAPPKWLRGVQGADAIALHAHILHWNMFPFGTPTSGARPLPLEVVAPLPQQWSQACAESKDRRLLAKI